MNVLMLVGSLRAESWTARLTAQVGTLLEREGATHSFAELGTLPHYSEDLDTDDAPAPAAVVALRAAIERADALLVATPEYNGSLPGVLKNAIDWASRPRGTAALAGKPVAVLSVSPSPRGAQWAREDAERVLRVAGAEVLPEAVGVPSVHSTLAEGRVIDPATAAALEHLVRTLVDGPSLAAA